MSWLGQMLLIPAKAAGFPSTLTATARGANGLSWVARCLFRVGSTLYAVLQTTAPTIQITVFRSIDLGRSWFAMDEAANPTSFANRSFSSWQNGTTIYVAYYSASGTIKVDRFSTATDTWLSSLGSAATDAAASATSGLRVVVRSDGDVLAFYRDTGNDAAVSIWEGVSWAKTVVASHATNLFFVMDAVVDGADYATLIFRETVALDVSAVTVSSTNVVGTIADLDGSAGGAISSGVYELFDSAGTDTLHVAWEGSTGALVSGNVALERANPTGTGSAVSATTVSDPGGSAVTLVKTNGDVIALWAGNVNGTIWSDRFTGAWGTDQEWKTGGDGLQTTPIHMIAHPHGVAVLYQLQSGVTQFDWFEAA